MKRVLMTCYKSHGGWGGRPGLGGYSSISVPGSMGKAELGEGIKSQNVENTGNKKHAGQKWQ